MRFMDALRDKGVQTSIHYPPIHQFTYYKKNYSNRNDDLASTEYVGLHQVTLPLYPSLREQDIDYIVSCVKDALKVCA
jgi:dTDP-4-amino-4,6-dideoxygalactose transaminase